MLTSSRCLERGQRKTLRPNESWHAEQQQKHVRNLAEAISIGLFSGARVGSIGLKTFGSGCHLVVTWFVSCPAIPVTVTETGQLTELGLDFCYPDRAADNLQADLPLTRRFKTTVLRTTWAIDEI